MAGSSGGIVVASVWMTGSGSAASATRLTVAALTAAPAIDALEISVLERRFQHPGNPVLTFCFANAVSITDASGNRKLDKSATRFRIDGAVAAAMAIGCKARDRTETEDEPSIYEIMAAEAAAREAAH